MPNWGGSLQNDGCASTEAAVPFVYFFERAATDFGSPEFAWAARETFAAAVPDSPAKPSEWLIRSALEVKRRNAGALPSRAAVHLAEVRQRGAERRAVRLVRLVGLVPRRRRHRVRDRLGPGSGDLQKTPYNESLSHQLISPSVTEIPGCSSRGLLGCGLG